MATHVSDNSLKLQEFTKQYTTYDNESLSENNSKKVEPHYQVPNLTSMLYEYTNKERD